MINPPIENTRGPAHRNAALRATLKPPVRAGRKALPRLRKRDRIRAVLKRLDERRKARPKGKRIAKGKAALVLSASAMAMNTGMVDTTNPGQPVSAPVFSQQFVDPTEVRVDATDLNVSDDFKVALIEEEGVRQTVYRDVAGYPTVGVGHLVLPEDDLQVGDRITQEEVLEFLDADLAKAEDGVRELVGDLELYQHEFDALVDLVFNVGKGNVSEERRPKLNAAIEAGDYDAIAEELDYHHAGGKIAKGLVHRSERRTQIFMDAEYEDPRDDA